MSASSSARNETSPERRPVNAGSAATLPRVSDPARSFDPARAADVLKQARAS